MINTKGMTEASWFDFTVLELGGFGGTLAKYTGDWQQCAQAWMLNPNISGNNVPDPAGFTSWQEWADRFNQAIFG